ncbi:hypothetical protein ASD21_04840 [Caulobacter sp. Root1455]|uniref:hypothetical protein n=1 Tax=unclassified Caulobacter TaxID=2648921 RepID=UPI0006FA38EF|nr:MULTISPECIES: hypothetical protein [unclassified Caulobacter]KQY29579.1 hypothetical protein ASD38_09590 [Caulobacter sp. Root487D2Y]KQY95839.1 hypothetical protein ASD21_04840 [Caulobacter sp. Root1455]
MLLSALLLAAAIQAAPTPDPSALGDQGAAGQTTFDRSMEEVRDAIKVRAACRTSGVELAVNTEPATRAEVKKLGDLPPANHTLTVLRSVDGCPVSSTVRYNVDRPAGR